MGATKLKEAIRREAQRLFGAEDTDALSCPAPGSMAPEPMSAGGSPTVGEEGGGSGAGRSRRSIFDFAGLAGADLVRAAYGVLLEREPDEDGFRHYLSGLVTGRFTAVDVLGSLRYSPEGRRRGVAISGLFFPFVWSRLARLPVLGPIFRPMALLAGHRLLEARSHAAHENATHRLESLAGNLQTSLARTDARLTAVIDELAALRRDMFGEIQTIQAHQASAVQERLRRLEENLRQVNAAAQSLRRAILLLDRRTAPSPSPETPEALTDVGYLLFEDAFRGSDTDLRNALAVYLPLLRTAPIGPDRPVLDLGCGRGVWLALLRDHGYRAVGVDTNEAAAQAARADGLEVTIADAESFLDAAAPGSYGAVTAFHLLEHVPPERWLPLLSRIHRVLALGGLALVETPNPRHLLVAFGDFHRDPTHVKPVFPDTLAFLGEAAGFAESAAWFFDTDRTRLIRADAVAFDTLQDYLDVSRDFAWTGRKRP